MIKLERGPAPDCWTRENVKKWTQSWVVKNNKGTKWAWPQVRGEKINHIACTAMEPWHHHKCAFCETPLDGHREIEHFRSKTRHPGSAFLWQNLFLACRACNEKKGVSAHGSCLKPDHDDPATFLWVNPITRRMEPRPGIPTAARERAEQTIRLYHLDRPELTKLYEAHLLQIFLGRSILSLIQAVRRPTEAEPGGIGAGLPFHRSQLKALDDPSQPFSLMVRSILEIY